MPQPRQRIVFCDCLDCIEQPSTTDIASSTSPANDAAVRQEPPPKCLLFVLSGVLLPRPDDAQPGAATILDTCNLPHLDRATAQGSLCLLTLEQQAPADCCSEVLQVLSLYKDKQDGSTPPKLADRFMGMSASFASNSIAAQQLARTVGMEGSDILLVDSSMQDGDMLGDLHPQLQAASKRQPGSGNAVGSSGSDSSAFRSAGAAVQQVLPDPAEAARRILQELGLQQADAGLDMVILQLDVDSAQQQQQHSPLLSHGSIASAADVAVALLSWVDKTLRYLNNSDAFKDTVLLTVVATPGSSQQPAAVPLLATPSGTELLPLMPTAIAQAAEVLTHQQSQHHQQQQLSQLGQRRVFKPLQSCEQSEGHPIEFNQRRVMLCMRRLPGVIRRDMCSRFTLKELCRASAMLAVLADRLLPEIAYKIGRAPKYGA